MKKTLLFVFIALLAFGSCSKNTSGTVSVVKPRYHHSLYKDHTHKKKWHVGRIKIRPEKQGVKRTKMKS
jgi:hypothetical protein